LQFRVSRFAFSGAPGERRPTIHSIFGPALSRGAVTSSSVTRGATAFLEAAAKRKAVILTFRDGYVWTAAIFQKN
jgi:hypothetical protein